MAVTCGPTARSAVVLAVHNELGEALFTTCK
jgi:hypothetical protein